MLTSRRITSGSGAQEGEGFGPVTGDGEVAVGAEFLEGFAGEHLVVEVVVDQEESLGAAHARILKRR